MHRVSPNRLGLLVGLALVAFATLTTMAQPQFDLVIRGGDLIDGSGAPGRRADIAVRGEAIVDIGDLANATATRTINAEGMVVSPGFIDMHSIRTRRCSPTDGHRRRSPRE